MEKRCSSCKEIKDVSEFHKNKVTPDGFQNRCKLCRTKRYDSEARLLKKKYDSLYHAINREKHSKYRREYYIDNLEYHIVYNKKYHNENKNTIATCTKRYRGSPAKYTLYYGRLTVDEAPRLGLDGVSLEVKCKYCGKYFVPTNSATGLRVHSLNADKVSTSGFLYCSNGCKASCPIYGKHKYPEGFKKATSREVNPLLRQMSFERDNWECQRCGKSVGEVILHCHHIEGYAQNPAIGNDIDNVITLCEEHHKEVHSSEGCRYNELGCKREVIDGNYL